MAAVGGHPCRPRHVRVLPQFDPLSEGDPPGGGVEVGVGGLVDVDLLAAQLGGGAGGVGRVGTDAAVGQAESDPEAGAALFYPGHGLLPSRMWSSWSGGCTLWSRSGGKSRSRTVGARRRGRRPTAGWAAAVMIAARSVGEKRRCLPRNVHGT